MNAPIEITISKDTASQAIADKLAQCDPHKVATRMAVPLARHWRDHLAGLPQNKRGYPSTGFWEDAARRVVGVAEGPTVRLYSDKLGLRQRYYGGTITARNGKNLTIPICAEAYGTTVSDWGSDNLTLVILADGRKFLALYLGTEANQQVYQNTVGKTLAQFYTRKGKGQIQARAAERTTRAVGRYKAGGTGDHPKVIVFKQGGGGSVSKASKHMELKFLFKLQPSVEQEGNPNVVPNDLNEKAGELLREAVN